MRAARYPPLSVLVARASLSVSFSLPRSSAISARCSLSLWYLLLFRTRLRFTSHRALSRYLFIVRSVDTRSVVSFSHAIASRGETSAPRRSFLFSSSSLSRSHKRHSHDPRIIGGSLELILLNPDPDLNSHSALESISIQPYRSYPAFFRSNPDQKKTQTGSMILSMIRILSRCGRWHVRLSHFSRQSRSNRSHCSASCTNENAR